MLPITKSVYDSDEEWRVAKRTLLLGVVHYYQLDSNYMLANAIDSISTGQRLTGSDWMALLQLKRSALDFESWATQSPFDALNYPRSCLDWTLYWFISHLVKRDSFGDDCNGPSLIRVESKMFYYINLQNYMAVFHRLESANEHSLDALLSQFVQIDKRVKLMQPIMLLLPNSHRLISSHIVGKIQEDVEIGWEV